ncbi:MAG: HrcA family transcriptional regulator [Candidatus Omnitrophota bacterium]
MGPKRADHRQRKERVLGIVVREYTRTVTPVSSGHITRQHLRDLSSATVRNILAELESDGLLTHPHTSAGRIPTQDGYRFYVDNLMEEIALLEEHKRIIRKEYQRERQNLEHLLEKTSEVLSDLTHYTTIVTMDGERRIYCNGTRYVVEYPDYQDIQQIRSILSLLEEKERLLKLINRELQRKIEIFIGQEIACRDVVGCAMAVSRYRTHKGASGRIAILGPARMDYQRVVSAMDYLSELMEEI